MSSGDEHPLSGSDEWPDSSTASDSSSSCGDNVGEGEDEGELDGDSDDDLSDADIPISDLTSASYSSKQDMRDALEDYHWRARRSFQLPWWVDVHGRVGVMGHPVAFGHGGMGTVTVDRGAM